MNGEKFVDWANVMSEWNKWWNEIQFSQFFPSFNSTTFNDEMKNEFQSVIDGGL